jgi:predicted nucleic acid-binding protein
LAEGRWWAETNSMSAKILVDSNILIYAHDVDEATKRGQVFLLFRRV